MRLSTNTGPISGKFGVFRAIEFISNAGFDCVDITSPSKCVKNTDLDYEKVAEQVRDFAEECGIEINQTHAVYPTSFEEAEKTEAVFERIVKDIHASAIMGAKLVVVHPNQHLLYKEEGNPEILKATNYEFYKRLLPYAEQYNIKIAIENMFQGYDGRCNDSTCSRPEEFNEYVDMMKDEHFIACVDIGHCGLVGGQTAADVLRAMGHRVKALHVHDNDNRSDYHLAPFTPYLGVIDWDDVCRALAEIDYSGDFTFEANSAFKNVNEDTVQSLCCYLHDIGRHLIDKIEKYKYEE